MINYDDATKEKINKHNSNWPEIPDHPYKTLTIVYSGSGKTNELLNLIKQQDNDDHSMVVKIYLYATDPYEAIYQYFIKRQENNGPKAFIENQNNMQVNYKNVSNVKWTILAGLFVANIEKNEKPFLEYSFLYFLCLI